MKTKNLNVDSGSKYDPELAALMKSTHAKGAVVIVIDGRLGNGLAIGSRDPSFYFQVPSLLKDLAECLGAQQGN